MDEDGAGASGDARDLVVVRRHAVAGGRRLELRAERVARADCTNVGTEAGLARHPLCDPDRVLRGAAGDVLDGVRRDELCVERGVLRLGKNGVVQLEGVPARATRRV